ncbi:MAG: hydantoinase B/oxoprolinase family protein, partial [Alphaproteobacteria bacterium]|nr:hydantoinase B/oxoprolinase family protein [Alphaproteobacteria bacterium]
MTAAVARAAVGLDPITLEVMRHKLDGIANEMELTLFRSAFSTIVKEALDASAALFTVQGETLAQAIAVPNHLLTLVPMLKALLRDFPLDGMAEGDLYILNDPYAAGGTHIPDIAVVMPIFHRGRPIAFSTALTHHQDVGGMAPGSTPTDATEIYQEGLRIPPLKLRDRGRMDETLVALLRQNVRLPDIFMGDLDAQIACCTIGARRLSELADAYGDNQLLSLFAALLDHSEQLTRRAIAGIPDGTYRYVDWLDNDGVDLETPVRVAVAVTVKGEEMHFDFTGTSAQVRGPINAPTSGSYAAACFALRGVTDPDSRVPTNGGCFRPLSFHLPEGSLVNPREPAPLGCRALTVKRLAGSILGALRQAVPDRVPADSGDELMILHLGGQRADGTRFVTSQLLAAGTGASRRGDGTDVIETNISNCMNVPAEAIMMEAPIRVHSMALAPDSGGAGTWRGGLGCLQEFEVLDGEVTATYRGERHFHAAAGAEGGGPGGRAWAIVRRAGGGEEPIASKRVMRLVKGDRLSLATAGGGGLGDPARRPRERVARDIRD